MSKTFIIITRENTEYDNFWGFPINSSERTQITRKNIQEECRLIFIKQERGYALGEYSELIIEELNGNIPDEVGIILHLAGGNNEANTIRNSLSDEIKAKVKFCTWYSITLEGFWDETNLNKSLPYNALRLTIEDGSEQLAAFNKVWNFFLCDPILEAKLELLQNILNDETPNPAILTLLRINLTNFDEDFKNFKKTPDTDIFSPEYRVAFGVFRDALAVE